MGCNSKSTTNTSTSIPQWMSDAGQANYNYAKGVAMNPPAYGGPTPVADPTGNQNSAWSAIGQLANTQNPYTPQIATDYTTYGNAPQGQVQDASLIGNIPGQGPDNSGGGSVANYMDPFIQSALDPTLNSIRLQSQMNAKDINAEAAMHGAFGDAQTGVQQGQNTKNTGIQLATTEGQGLEEAYKNAMGLRSQDISNLMNVTQSNAALREAALNRQQQAGTDLMGLDKYNTGRSLDLANAQSTAGGQQYQIAQAKAAYPYQEFQRQQQQGLDYAKLATASLNVPHDTTGTSTTTAPDNSWMKLLGAVV